MYVSPIKYATRAAAAVQGTLCHCPVAVTAALTYTPTRHSPITSGLSGFCL